MYRLAVLSLVLLICDGCTSSDHHTVSETRSSEPRVVEGLGQFRLDDEDMWEGEIEVDGEPVKVFLHAYNIDFDTLSSYAKRVLARRPFPDEQMLADVKNGIEELAWKFKKYDFSAEKIELQKFRVERLVIGKDFEGPDIELGITLKYPGDANQWHLKFFREGDRGSLNWIPKVE